MPTDANPQQRPRSACIADLQHVVENAAGDKPVYVRLVYGGVLGLEAVSGLEFDRDGALIITPEIYD